MKIRRWQTPVSDLKFLSKISFVDEDRLILNYEGGDGSSLVRVRFVFSQDFAYRTLLEEYRLSLWKDSGITSSTGWTMEIAESPWIHELLSTEPLFELHGGAAAKHYLICTEDDVVDVLAREPPEIVVEEA